MLSIKNLLVASGFISISYALTLADPAPDQSCQICIDQVNECGQIYGGCYDLCQNPRKTFDVPACNGQSGKLTVCEYMKNDCGVKYGGCYPAEGPIPLFEKPACPAPDESCRICIDNANECGQLYGGCYDFCAEQRKTFDVPECNGQSGKLTVCEYMKNSCGKVFGGCYPAEGPIPGWADPGCP